MRYDHTYNNHTYTLRVSIEQVPNCCGAATVHGFSKNFNNSLLPESEQKKALRGLSDKILHMYRNTWGKIIVLDAIGGECGRSYPSLWKMVNTDKKTWRRAGKPVYNPNSGNRIQMWEYNRPEDDEYEEELSSEEEPYHTQPIELF